MGDNLQEPTDNQRLTSQELVSNDSESVDQDAQVREEKHAGGEDNGLPEEEITIEEEKEDVEMAGILDYLRKSLDYELEGFTQDMWTPELRQNLASFITAHERAYFWVEADRVDVAFDEFPEGVVSQIACCVKTEPETRLQLDTIERQLIIKSVDPVKDVQSLVDELSYNHVPAIAHDHSWPDNTRKDLLLSTHKFLAHIVELRAAKEHKTMLYIPNENLDRYLNALNLNNQDHKDFIQRAEWVVANWAKQLKDLLNVNQSRADNDASGPLEEINFWKDSKSNFNFILDQVSNVRVQRLLSTLRLAGSVQVKTIEQLIEQIESGAQQAQENLKYLRIIEEPCTQLLTVSSKDIPKMLKTLFFSVRMIWEKCSYYSTEERIASLLRKVSNQIIKRCSSTINIDQLFSEDVKSCIKELNRAKSSCRLWREMYEHGVKAMSTGCWSFDSDSVFAQTEAFVQRCNDLKVLCYGQMQFARKGLAEPPLFSGNKSNEIVQVLKEIKEVFEKLLERLKGDSIEKVLDIKSTKWHDDFNVFKNGLKNLDNMFINLVNFAFDNVVTVEQSVEYMVAFKELSARKSIQLNIDKKIDKVNELVLRELKAIEAHAKSKPNSRVYTGHYSAKAMWCKNLLSRVNRVSYLYRRLIWIERRHKEPVEAELTRLDTHLRLQMAAAFKEFKEYTKDLETSYSKRLDQNILIEASKAKPLVHRSKHPLLKHVNMSEYIECNFDKMLLSFITELRGFQKLVHYGLPNYGGKLEEVVMNQKDKLRVHKENVMLVVRDYNEILGCIDYFERELFNDHLESINSSIARGLKILRWSSQGTLDNFVKECRAKCAKVRKTILDFKQTKTAIEEKVRELGDKVKLIQFDARKMHDLAAFVSKQERNREQARIIIERCFNEIEAMCSDVYDEFINKSLRIQKCWFRFVKEVDGLIEEEFNKIARTSLQEFYKTMSGDENTNPTQIFKIYILLEVREKGNELSFDPPVKEFNLRISEVLESSLRFFKSFKKFPSVIYEARKAKINRIVLEAEHEASTKKFGGKKGRPSFPDVPEEIADTRYVTYDARIMEELQNLKEDIESSFAGQTSKLHVQLDPWKEGCFLRMGIPNPAETARLLRKDTQIAEIANALAYYDTIQSEIQGEKGADDSICIHVDVSRLKSRLIELNYEEQKMLLTAIKDKAVEELRNLTKKFTDAEKAFSNLPTDLQMLKDAMDLVSTLLRQRNAIEESLIPLEEKFRLLDDYMMVFKDEETRMRAAIKDSFDRFNDMLLEVKSRNEKFYVNFQNEHLNRIADFEREVRDQKAVFVSNMPVNGSVESIDAVFRQIDGFKDTFNDIKEKENSLRFGFDLFKINYSPIPEIAQYKDSIDHLEAFWKLRAEWNKHVESLMSTQFFAIDVESILSGVKSFKDKFIAFPAQVKRWEAAEELLEDVNKFVRTMQLVLSLQDKCLRERHWRVIMEQLKESFDISSEEFSLRKVIELDIEGISEAVRDVHDTAEAEFKIELALEKINQRWRTETLIFDVIKNTDVRVVNSQYADRITEYLEEDLVMLSSLKTNAYAAVFGQQIDRWDSELNKIAETMDLLLLVQRKFVYFNNIFVNLQEEVGQLKGDKSVFNNVRSSFCKYLELFEKIGNTKSSLLHEGFSQALNELSRKLDHIQKNMRKYLEKRRVEVPRFYFLSDEDIFEILGKSRDPECLNKHVKKMFEGIKRLAYAQSAGRPRPEYTKMEADGGERVEFVEKVDIIHDVNAVITGVERQMKERLATGINESITYIEAANIIGHKSTEKLERWINEYPGQVVLTSAQIEWTAKIMTALSVAAVDPKSKKPNVKDNWTALKTTYTKYVQDLIGLIRKTQDPLLKAKLVALITIEVHQRDLIDKLTNCNTSSHEWVQSLKFFGSKDQVYVQQGNGRFEYGYEYQGNNGRLVITPLTDRCYLTLTTALHYNRGGNPQGPAGTGKTETVKDLGKNLARFVFIFNCSESVDVKNMKEMLEGFAMTGFWGCFDEFNRIDIEVLSVVAVQINTILEAMVKRKEVFDFEDKEISLNANCALFITMNPGYAGRTELPDNLKSLFRPISMITPDSMLICRISMQAEGFKTADALSKKIDSLYRLMKQNLSSQRHYDFGLRAVKSALVLAGDMRREFFRDSKDAEAVAEQKVMIKAISLINEPKLLAEDLILFEALLNDVFPEEKDKDDNDELLKHIDEAMEELCLDKNPYFVEKVIQLYYTKNTRHGNIVIGDSMSGKSELLRVLKMVQTEKGVPTKSFAINPKVFSVGEIYGYYDIVTDESIPGVFSHLMDELCNREESADERWVVFDGPIDTKWIESMNSLLDDNKILTLLNGQRINLKPNVKILFEVTELNQASPATVSRCGMVYLDASELTWTSAKLHWLFAKEKEGCGNALLDCIEDLIDKWLEPLLKKRRELEAHKLAMISETSETRNFFKLFDILFEKVKADYEAAKHMEETKVMLLEKIFVYALIWSVGANLTAEGKALFDQALRDIDALFPFALTVYDYFLAFEKNEFVPWETRITMPPQNWKPSAGSSDYLVETIDTLRTKRMLGLMLEAGQNVLGIGESGVGKTAIIKAVLDHMNEALYHYSVINMTPGTTSLKLQQNIESRLNRTTKKKYRPFGGAKGFVFIDNISMAKKDRFGYRPAAELLRQLVEHKGWYDRDSLDIYVDVIDLTCIAAMSDTETIPPQLLNKFMLYSFNVPGSNQIKRIYSSILYHRMAAFDPDEIKPELENVTKFIMGVFDGVFRDERLKATPLKPHYLFSMRDMTRIVEGVSMADQLNCDSKKILMKLLVHETHRVYKDKMITKEDRELVDDYIADNLDSVFAVRLEDIVNAKNPPVFVNFVDPSRNYNIVPESRSSGTDTELLKQLLNQHLVEYNKESKAKLDIVLFNEAVDNLCKINRTLSMRKGNLLLMGVGGTGRHSLTRLSIYLNGYDRVEFKGNELTPSQFRGNVKALFESIVSKNRTKVLLCGESDIKHEEVLEDINSLVSNGEIPNLYSKKEGRDDFSTIREHLKQELGRDNEEALHTAFVERVHNNLRVVFCVGATGEGLRRLIRNYNGFIYSTTQIYFENWPKSALFEVSSRFLDELALADSAAIADYFSHVHESATNMAGLMLRETKRSFTITPKHFIDFGKIFAELLDSKSREAKSKVEKYTNGLEKLEEAKETVEELKGSMDIKRLELHKKKKDCEEMIYKIEHSKRDAEKEKSDIEAEESQINKEKETTMLLTKESEVQLNKALPALKEADEKVKKLDNSSIAEIKVLLKTKDKRLELIMFALMVLLKEKPDWDSVMKVVVDANFLKRLHEIDKDKITEERVQKLEKFTMQPEIQGNLESYSKSVHTLSLYVRAVELYAKINLDVEPIRKRVKKLKAELAAKEKYLMKLKENLNKTLARLAELNAEFDTLNNEYKTLQTEFNTLEQRLQRSEKLVSGLGSSQENWEDHKKFYLEFEAKVMTNVLLAAPYLCYFGAFTSAYRDKLWKESLLPFLHSKGLARGSGYDFISFMVSEAEVLQWNFEGLPNDRVSIENAVIVSNSKSWPMLIDPQRQGFNWLKQMEKNRQVIILDGNTEKPENVIKKAVIDGIPLIVRDVEGSVPSAYEPLLSKNIKQIGYNRMVLHYNGEEISYHPEFKFYLTTRQSNPVLSPELVSGMTIVNFEVKQAGLEEQLLNVLLSILDEKVEQQRVECIRVKARGEKTLNSLEDQILSMLQTERDIPIVDAVDLIDTLQSSREKEEEIKSAMEINRVALKKNAAARESYRYVGQIASLLYFTVAQMEKINYVYQFPLEGFIKEFEMLLAELKEKKAYFSDTLSEKIKKIDQELRLRVYRSFSSSLFEQDRLLLASYLAITLAPIDHKNNKQSNDKQKKNMLTKLRSRAEEEEEPVDYFEERFPDELEFFIRSLKSVDRENQEMNPDPAWISQRMWDGIHELNRLAGFQGILGSFMHSTREWYRFFSSPQPEVETLTSDWSHKIKGFSLLLLIKVVRPDRVSFACSNYVRQVLGRQFVEFVSFDLKKAHERSLTAKKYRPVLIISSSNIDPWPYIEQLAGDRPLLQISLGKGQISRAKEKVLKGVNEGYWVYLGNMHLSKAFMKELERVIEYINSQSVKNSNFQLFLSTKAVPYIPLSLLHDCVKITLEPSKGIQPNMHKIITNLIPEYTVKESKDAFEEFFRYKKLVFALSWFHTILNERKRFKSLGWNVDYEFTDSDFVFSEKVLRDFVSRDLQWEALNHLIANINYTGRVTDKWDARVLAVYAKELFVDQLLKDPEFSLIGQENDQVYTLPPENEELMNNTKLKQTANINYFTSRFKGEFIDFIGNFPEVENPKIFGQHINAEISMRIEDSKALISALETLKGGLQVNINDDRLNFEVVAMVEDIRGKLPELLNLADFRDGLLRRYKDYKSALADPYNTVVIQEAKSYNKLLKLIGEDLGLIVNCVTGKTLMTEEVETILDNLHSNRLPERWGSFYLSNKPLYSWLDNLEQRVAQIKTWLQKGSLAKYWLGGLIFPSGFLTAVMQSTARKANLPMDVLKWEFSFIANESIAKSAPKDGAYVYGLYVEGAKWDRDLSCLADADPMQLHYNMPIIHFKPVEKITRVAGKIDYFECPCYTHQIRSGSGDNSSFVFSIPLPFEADRYNEAFWIKRGTALLLSLDH